MADRCGCGQFPLFQFNEADKAVTTIDEILAGGTVHMKGNCHAEVPVDTEPPPYTEVMKKLDDFIAVQLQRTGANDALEHEDRERRYALEVETRAVMAKQREEQLKLNRQSVAASESTAETLKAIFELETMRLK